MPIHDWTRVDAGIIHDFHLGWISELRKALNAGLLPPSYYALAEQIAGGWEPDVLTLQGPSNGHPLPSDSGSAVALATAPPQVWFHTQAEIDRYAAKAKAIAIRHVSDHRVIAVIEIVSPGNKTTVQKLRALVDKAAALLRAGVHLLIVDLFPTSSRDPQGIHKAIWDEFEDKEFALPAGRPLTVASYIGGIIPEAFIEPAAVATALPEMPLFLTPELYVPVPLEATYQLAWDGVPGYWRNVITATTTL